MKKLLIAATLAAAALGATSLMADSGHQHGQRGTGTAADCPMAGAAGDREARHAQMQARMQAMHAGMGTHEGHGQGRERGHEQH